MAEGGKVAEDLGLSDAALQAIIDGVAAKLQKAGHKDGTPRGDAMWEKELPGLRRLTKAVSLN